LGEAIAYLQLPLVPLEDLGEGAAPGLEAPVHVEAPQLAVTSSPGGNKEIYRLFLLDDPKIVQVSEILNGAILTSL